ncbi:MAG: cobyric acid synthase [Nitrososphaeraceae archaeon]
MKAKLLMIQGTTSGSGKSIITTAICRILSDEGYTVAPFKAQNMSSKLHIIPGTANIVAQAQAVQALASRKLPDSRMNPILLKPLGDYKSDLILAGRFNSTISSKDYYENFVMQNGFPLVLNSLESLRNENDIVVIEGAGSPAEINISKYDIANMLLAEKVSAPVLIVADIERGGCFSSIVGTMRLLPRHHKNLVKGFIINKFRGDVALLLPAIEIVREMLNTEILGVIPKIDLKIPDEDSLDGSKCNLDTISIPSLDKNINSIADVVRGTINIPLVISDIIRPNMP